MTTFGLVHGAWHGGWCWQYLIPELEVRGHRAVAIDLPTDDPQAGAERYAGRKFGPIPPSGWPRTRILEGLRLALAAN